MVSLSNPDVVADLETIFQSQFLKLPEDSLGFLLWQATHRWQRHAEQALHDMDMTHLQFVILSMLGCILSEDTGKPVTQARLATFASIHPMQVSQVVKALEGKRLVERRVNPADSRSWQLLLTPQGMRLLAQAMPRMCRAHQEFFSRIEGESDLLRRLLHMV